MRPQIAAAFFCLLPPAALSAAAEQDSTPAQSLPAMTQCSGNSRPLIAEKWHAVYLMAPFAKGQLVLGDFVYDGSIPAMRVRLYGLRHGALDLFIRGRNTRLLASDGTVAGDCRDLGDTGGRPFRRDWLPSNARCAGSAPVAGVDLSWWKMPSRADLSANWAWFETAERPPFRLMFTQPSDEPSVLGSFTLSYRIAFEALSATELDAISASCRPAKAAPQEPMALRNIIAAMERSTFWGGADIARLAPHLRPQCASGSLPAWRDRAAMTAIMTSPNFNESPMPAEILYDWSRKSQRTRMFKGPAIGTEDALLAGGEGYSAVRARNGRLACSGSLPGTLHPNWPETGGCSCEAMIEGNTPLTPYGPAQIMMCPMTNPRVVWSWFALDGRPMVFMETSAPEDKPAGVLTLIDYHSWTPGSAGDGSALDLPAQCRTPGGPHAEPDNAGCASCHLVSHP